MSATSRHSTLREDYRTYYEEAVRIPGFREAPNRCRGLTPVGFCDVGHVVLGRSSCGTRYCPDHWRDWIQDAVINAVARMAAYREVVDGAEKRVSHVVASPPQDRRYSVRALWETRGDAYDALEEAGVRGGVAVTHPYRTSERGDLLFETARDEGELDEDVGRWEFLRDAADDWEEMSQYVEASPHYHTLAAAEDVQSEDVSGGWIVERIRTMKPFHKWDTEAYRDMAKTVYYVLTHGGEMEGRQTVSYFGGIHPAGFRPEEELSAVVWDRIQEEARKAVKEAGDGQGLGVTEDAAVRWECPREGCPEAVHDVAGLPERMQDEDWKEKVRSGRDGQQRWLRLKGTLLWWEERTDRPPPAARRSEEKMLEWLEERGRVLTPRPSQVSLGAVLGAD